MTTNRKRIFAVFLCFALATPGMAIPVSVSNSPDSDYALTVKTIEGAKQSIMMNIYELTSPQIVGALIAQIRAGLQVTILEEGQPCCNGLSSAARDVQSQIVQAMQNSGKADHFYEMTADVPSQRRYRFDHAKYMVVDGDKVLVGSENYSPTGNPVPGTVGNRGWEVLISDSGIAQQFLGIFSTDTDLSKQDVVDLTTQGGSDSDLGRLLSGLLGGGAAPAPADAPQVSTDFPQLDASAVQLVTAPDTSLSGIQTLLRSATQSIDIEQMTFDSHWGGPGTRSPILDEVIAAARRGVTIRILLNDESVFDRPRRPAKHKNDPTLAILAQLAQSENLPITGRIANLQAMGVDYIHNKGALVDSDKTFVSSINWDENAVINNREAAVVITSPDVHRYYETLFQKDWDSSATRSAGVAEDMSPNSFNPNSFDPLDW